MRSSALAAAVLALFAVTGCGGSGGSPTGAPAATTAGAQPTAAPAATTGSGVGSADPCKLLTQADIKTATGVDYGAGVASNTQCIWLAGTDTVNTGNGQVVLGSTTGMSLADIKSSFTGGVDTAVGGHQAYWNPTAGLQTIWVDLGTSLLTVSIDPLPADGQAVAQHLAELAVAKI